MRDTTSMKTLSVSQLFLDTQNPRLPDIQSSQHEVIRAMAIAQADKIISLAEHLVNNGPNPANLPIVMPSNDMANIYYVLDGNRRITALKLLESPSLADGILNGQKMKKLRQMSAKFEKNPITELSCMVVADRDEADRWIQLIHRGEQQGAGLVEWDGQVAARYDARRTSKPHFALEVLDYVKKHAPLSDHTFKRINDGKFPITNLERLLNTPYVRKKLGIDIAASDGTVQVMYPEEEVLKGLARVVDDLGSGRVTVSKIKSQEQRIDYINSLSEHELPKAESALPAARPLGAPPEKAGTSGTSGQKPRGQTRGRSTLIPKNCKLKISHHRINKIYTELKQLNVDEFPNAGAVMLRVFVELSLDDFLEHTMNWPEKQIEGSVLAHKLTAVADHFESNNIMTNNQLAAIRKTTSGQTLLVASIKTMHGYVHNRHFSPISSEIKMTWDDIQLFIENIWQI